MKIVLTLFVFVTLALSQEKTVLNFWTPFSGGDARPMHFIVDKFNASQDEIVVNMGVTEWAKYYPKLLRLFQEGGAPDIAIIHSSKLAEYVDIDGLSTLEEFVEEERIDWNDFLKSVRKEVTFNKKHYALPIDKYVLLTYYNKKYLKEAGLLKSNGELNISENKEGIVTFFRSLKNSLNKNIVPLGQPIDNIFPFWLWFSFYNQIEGGGEYIKDNRAVFNNRAGLKALEFLVTLRDAGIYNKKINDLQGYNMFKYEKSAVFLTGGWATWNFEQNRDLDFGVAPFIKVFDKRVVTSDSHTITIPKTVDKKRGRAALKFALFVVENGLDWSLAGHIPISKKVRESKEYLAQPIRSKYREYLDFAVAYPKHKRLWVCNDKLVEIFADMMESKAGAKETLDLAEIEINKILKR